MSTDHVDGELLVVWWKSDADGWYEHPERQTDAEAAEEVGEQLLDTGAEEVMICVPGEKPWEINAVLNRYEP